MAHLDHPLRTCKNIKALSNQDFFNGRLLYLLSIISVHLLLVFPALGLAVRAIPVKQDREGNDEKRVRYRDRRHD